MYSEITGYKTERLTADGAINGGKPLKLVGFLAKTGGTAGLLEWHEGVDALTPAEKRGGGTVAINTWAFLTGAGQQLSKCFVNIDANITEFIAVYRPGQV